LYEVVNLGRGLFEHKRPEVWDLLDELGALLVQRSMESFSFADCKLLI
jgi:hypothetical protein